MTFGLRSTRLALGVDIGSSSLKVVKLARKSSRFLAVAAARAQFSSSEGQKEEECLRLLKELLERRGLQKEPISLILPGREGSVRFFSLPKMPREELGPAVAWEAAKHASLPAEALITDFVAFAATPGQADGQHNIMAVMMPRDRVEHWVRLSSQVGLRLAAIDLPAMALLAHADLQDLWAVPGCTAMLDLGHSRTGIHLFQERRLCFTRDIAIGGNDITQTLVDVLHVDFEQAEQLKIRLGVAGSGPEGDKVRQIIEQTLERIAVEVQRSFDYYQAQYREASFAAVRLCGGTALLPGIARYFTEALRLESSVDQPWRTVPLGPAAEGEDSVAELGALFSCAVGLATRQDER